MASVFSHTGLIRRKEVFHHFLLRLGLVWLSRVRVRISVRITERLVLVIGLG